MISGATSCFPIVSQGLQMYGTVSEPVVHSSLEASPAWETHSNSLLYSLSVLKEKVHQVESLVTIFISPNQSQPTKSTAIAIATMGTLVQEIMVIASSMMFTCQQMGSGSGSSSTPATATTDELQNHRVKLPGGGGFYPGETLDWYGDNNYNNTCNTNGGHSNQNSIAVGNNNEMGRREVEDDEGSQGLSPKNYDIIELDAADLLAKYTHYCQVCGKGFKRDANLRMHMRAHGDEYKSSAALSNPTKSNAGGGGAGGNKEGAAKQARIKYSCPQEGCRWNRNHAKFQPLKSIICVKNHYKRSHCPKMYVCKRCNRKQFSVLSDLRTHEKHCGDLKWQCSCGTTFSRKDKLMGHLALFAGHSPAVDSSVRMAKVQRRDQIDMSR